MNLKNYSDNKHVIPIYIWIFFLILLWNIFYKGISSRASENAEIDGELVILIDNSKSITSELQKDIKEWATEIGAYIQDTGIVVHLVSFDGIDSVHELYSGEIISEKNEEFKKYVDSLEELHFDKQWTDQAGAFKNAVELLKQSKAGKKCIVMLSDAELSYEDTTKEEEGKRQFKEGVEGFADPKTNQKVILIGFGDNIGLFEGLKNAILLSPNQEQEQSQKQLEEGLQEVFEGLGVIIKKDSLTIEEHQVTFNLEKDYYRVVLNVMSSNDTIDENLADAITVSRETEEGLEKVENSFISSIGDSCYIYFFHLITGDYIISLPDDWECHIIKQQKVVVNDIMLSAISKNGDVICEGEIYQIYEDNFMLRIEVGIKDAELIQDLQHLLYEYRIVPVEEDIQKVDINEDGPLEESYNKVNVSPDKNGVCEQSIEISQLGDGKYNCQVRILQGGVECASAKIMINVDSSHEQDMVDNLVTEDEKLPAKIGETINVREVFDVPDDGCFEIKVNEETEIRCNGYKKTDDFEYANENLTFFETGDYKVVCIDTENNIKTIKTYEVRARNCFERIIEFFKKLFS